MKIIRKTIPEKYRKLMQDAEALQEKFYIAAHAEKVCQSLMNRLSSEEDKLMLSGIRWFPESCK